MGALKLGYYDRHNYTEKNARHFNGYLEEDKDIKSLILLVLHWFNSVNFIGVNPNLLWFK